MMPQLEHVVFLIEAAIDRYHRDPQRAEAAAGGAAR